MEPRRQKRHGAVVTGDEERPGIGELLAREKPSIGELPPGIAPEPRTRVR
jgi:hypothetical protein